MRLKWKCMCSHTCRYMHIHTCVCDGEEGSGNDRTQVEKDNGEVVVMKEE